MSERESLFPPLPDVPDDAYLERLEDWPDQPASETVDAWDIVKELHAEDCPKRTVGWCNCGVQGPLNRFYAAIRAAALDEARAAVEGEWDDDDLLNGKWAKQAALAAIDALRRDEG